MARIASLTVLLSVLALGVLGCSNTSQYWADTPPLIAPSYTAPLQVDFTEHVAVADDAIVRP